MIHTSPDRSRIVKLQPLGMKKAVTPPGWPKSLSTLGLARPTCVFCHGHGWIKKPKGANVCKCVYRAIFNACLKQYCRQEEAPPPMRPRFRVGHGAVNCCSYPRLEWQADFIRLAERTLKPQELELFRLHYLKAMDWKTVAVKLGVNNGTFWHLVYAIQEKYGEAAVTAQPYGLFPIDQYLGAANTIEKAAKRFEIKANIEYREHGTTLGRPLGAKPQKHHPWRDFRYVAA